MRRSGQERPHFRLNFTSTGASLDSRLTFTRASSASYFDSAGAMQTASSNTARFDYNPSTLVPRGFLIEESRTNLFLNSASLSTQNVAVSATAYTLSFYGTGTITLSGASTAGPLTGSGAFPTRSTLTFTPSAGTLTCTVTGTVQYAQIEAGSFATSWIPTTGATVTRAADVCSIATSAFPFNASEGTIVVKGLFPNNSSQIIQIDDGSGSNRIAFTRSSGGLFNPFIVSGGATVATLTQGAMSASTPDRMAVSYALDNFASCLNGGSLVTDTSGAVPVSPTTLRLVATSGGVSGAGWIQSFAYYPRRLANTQLAALTA